MLYYMPVISFSAHVWASALFSDVSRRETNVWKTEQASSSIHLRKPKRLEAFVPATLSLAMNKYRSELHRRAPETIASTYGEPVNCLAINVKY